MEGMKKCTKCHRTMVRSAFYLRGDGYVTAKCRDCTKSTVRDAYHRRREQCPPLSIERRTPAEIRMGLTPWEWRLVKYAAKATAPGSAQTPDQVICSTVRDWRRQTTLLGRVVEYAKHIGLLPISARGARC